MGRTLSAVLVFLAFGLWFASCGEEETGEVDTTEGETVEETPGEVAEEPEPSFAVGDIAWATYYDPEYVSALSWERTEVIAVEGDQITVEFQGFLNDGERETRHTDWLYPYVESFGPEEAVVGAAVVIEPPGTSFVAYPGTITEIKEGAFVVDYEIDGIAHTDEFALEGLH